MPVASNLSGAAANALLGGCAAADEPKPADMTALGMTAAGAKGQTLDE